VTDKMTTESDKGQKLRCKVVMEPEHYAYYKRMVIPGLTPANAPSGKTVTRRVFLTCEQGHDDYYEVQVPEEE
jgi:hypothetical protein